MHRDSDGFERFSKWPPAVHDRDLHVKRGPVAMSKHVQKRGLRPAEIEMIDDVQDADHRWQVLQKGFNVCVVIVPLAHEARAFVLGRHQTIRVFQHLRRPVRQAGGSPLMRIAPH